MQLDVMRHLLRFCPLYDRVRDLLRVLRLTREEEGKRRASLSALESKSRDLSLADDASRS